MLSKQFTRLSSLALRHDKRCAALVQTHARSLLQAISNKHYTTSPTPQAAPAQETEDSAKVSSQYGDAKATTQNINRTTASIRHHIAKPVDYLSVESMQQQPDYWFTFLCALLSGCCGIIYALSSSKIYTTQQAF